MALHGAAGILARMRLFVAAALALVLSTACAHTTTIRSEPAGADVFVDGARVGATPYDFDEPVGPMGGTDVEVRDGTGGARFRLQRQGFAWQPIGAAFGGVLGTSLVLCGAALPWAPLALSSPDVPDEVAYVGTAFLGAAIVTCGVGLFAAAFASVFGLRTGPDTVTVDLEDGSVRGDPPDLVDVADEPVAARAGAVPY